MPVDADKNSLHCDNLKIEIAKELEMVCTNSVTGTRIYRDFICGIFRDPAEFKEVMIVLYGD